MTGKKIIYYLFAAFITGNILLIYIYHNSGKNISSLVHGDKKLLYEFRISSTLKELEREIILVENKVTGAVTTNDARYAGGLQAQFATIRADLVKLQQISGKDSSIRYISKLDQLTRRKLEASRQAMDVFTTNGKAAAEKLIATQTGRGDTDSILQMVQKIAGTRQELLTEATSSIDESGEKARQSGTIMIMAVLTGGALIFWYIINTLRNQNQLIHQLHVSEKKVREAAKVKENFLANMSHEIRTPMNAILGFTSLLSNKSLDNESRQFVQTIHRSAEDLLTIINDILDLSKLESGMMRMESAPFSIRTVLHSVETLFRSKLAEKGLNFLLHTDDSIPDMLQGDAVRLTQILVNIAGNAIKFTERGLVSLRVTHAGSTGNNIRIGIAVSDTGIGIAKEKLATIFDRFYQAEDSTTRRYGGTGLGLSIVKDLVLLQNGSIDVESTPGKGTTFRLVMPYAIAATAAPARQATAQTVVPAAGLADLCVLVVEDNRINQSLIRHIFQNWKLSFELAGNGKEAVHKLRSSAYDLILMDIQMPVMDGYTATQEIRNVLRLQTPIIAMTARAMAGEKERCISYGMNEYISKPIKEDQLHKLIVQLTQKEFTGGQQAPAPARGGEYEYINLQYMLDISAGDAAYEKLVTGQFIEAVPAGLQILRESWNKGNREQIRHTAHDMKTTVSVMGIDDMVHPYLDALEHASLTEETFHKYFTGLQSVCHAALEEAKHFYAGM